MKKIRCWAFPRLNTGHAHKKASLNGYVMNVPERPALTFVVANVIEQRYDALYQRTDWGVVLVEIGQWLCTGFKTRREAMERVQDRISHDVVRELIPAEVLIKGIAKLNAAIEWKPR
jgi:hypothetical protein